jgi:FkbM family methyltransferase
VFSNPQHVIDQAYVGEGMHIADIGAGVGNYVIPLAEKVGASGRVYAIDVQKDLLSRVKTEAERKHKNNVMIIAADAEKNTGIVSESLDRVFLANALFQFEDKEGACQEVKRLLKKNGRVVLVDWSGSFGNMGPHKDQVITKEEAETLFLKNGFDVEREITAGDHHYGLIFKLPNQS